MSNNTTLILHGWGGNKPEHWQEHLATTLRAAGQDVRYPKLPNPTAPNLAAWLEEIEKAAREVYDNYKNTTVVCHSLGAISWLHYADKVMGRLGMHALADRVLLVAPPYVVPGIPPWSAPATVDTFFPPPLNADAIAIAARITHLVGGNDDDYATWEQMETYAKRLNIECTMLPGAGHISPYWGYGKWQWVEDWCLGNAELPPVSNK